MLLYEVCLTDGEGQLVTDEDTEVTVQATNGKFIGTGSANPYSEEIFSSGTFSSYRGRLLLAVMKEGDREPSLQFTAASLLEN